MGLHSQSLRFAAALLFARDMTGSRLVGPRWGLVTDLDGDGYMWTWPLCLDDAWAFQDGSKNILDDFCLEFECDFLRCTPSL